MKTDDEATQGYYLVKWITEPYTVQEDIIMKGSRPTTNCFCWGNNLWCTVLESSTRGGKLVHTNEKTGGTGYDKTETGADDRCDDDENNRG